MRNIPLSLLLTAAFFASSAAPATITDLGTLGGTGSAASGINALGQVVGDASLTGDVNQHATLYSAGKLTDLGTLGGTGSGANGINATGQVTGYAFKANGDIRAFLYSNGAMTDLGTFVTATGATSVGYAINAAGQIAGSSDLVVAGNPTEHAFLYTAGVMKDLGTLGGNSSRGYGINASGQTVGDADVTGFIPSHAFLYSGATLKDLGTLGGASSSATAINDAGQIVGNSEIATNSTTAHAFLYSGGVMKDLGTLGGGSSFALAINGAGQIVGGSNVAGTFVQHAFLYANGAMTDLNAQLPANSGWVLENATAINDAGQVAGFGLIGGKRHAFLMNDVTAGTPQGQSQTISFAAPANVTLGVLPFSLTATASSGLTVAFASSTTSVCTVSGTTVTIVAAGTCTITASQTGNTSFQAATPVTQSFTVSAAAPPQKITFAALPDVTFGAAPFTVSATASSGLAVTFSSSPASVCTNAGATVTIAGGGLCSITATQPGSSAASVGAKRNAATGAALPVTQSFTVRAASGGPSISAGGIVSLFSTVTTVQPGSWISIFGANLASATTIWSGEFPTALGGTSVTIDGRKAYLWFVSTGQINLQVPDDPNTGTVNVTLATSKGNWTSTVTLAPLSPTFSLLDARHVTGIILRPNGSGSLGSGANSYDILGPTGTSLGYKSVAAKQGDSVVLFALGLGPTTPPIAAGKAFAGAAATATAVKVAIGNITVTPAFAGLSSAGLYQINLTIPAGLGTGDLPLSATVGSGQTQASVVISLQ